MGDKSHARVDAYFERMLSDPLIELVMKADRIDRHAMKQALCRASLTYYPGRSPHQETASVPHTYRPSVGIALFNRSGQVFVGRRSDMDREAWQMPQGGIDEGETPKGAALRELREEIGTDNVILLGEQGGWVRYDLPDHLIGHAWGGAWRGQKQRWFAMGLLGHDAEIDIQTAHPEFSDWRWVDLDALPKLVVEFKRAAYHAVTRAFAPITAVLASSVRTAPPIHAWRDFWPTG